MLLWSLVPVVGAQERAPEEELAETPIEEADPIPEKKEKADDEAPAESAPAAAEEPSETPIDEADPVLEKKEEADAEAPVETTPAAEVDSDQKQKTAGQKWRLFRDATRGLITWDLFKGNLTLRAYARLQIDGTAAGFNDPLAIQLGEDKSNSLHARRLTLYADGTINGRVRYVVGWNFVTDAGIDDAFIQGTKDGLRIFGYRIGRFRVGFFQEPFSLERSTSSFWGGFAERSLPAWTFAPGSNLGYMVFDTAHKERISWAAGFFSFGQSTENNASTSLLSVSARLTGRPIWREEGRRLVHVGAAYSNRTPSGGETQYRSRPEARFVEFLADTGTLDSSRIQLSGLEAAAVRGPLWLQAEAISSRVTATDLGRLSFWGSYVQAGYFLTGEVRPYATDHAVFGRLIPTNDYHKGSPFKRANGGAWEVTARLSNVDLNDGGIRGGAMTDLSLGLNWYPNATSRVVINYIRSRTEAGGRANIGVLRYQYRPRAR